MIAVIFEVMLNNDAKKKRYLHIAHHLQEDLETMDGFISIERYQSVSSANKMLSLSFWRDEQAVHAWRQLAEHRKAQDAGRREVFQDYRLRVAAVLRDYSMNDREQAPADSRAWHEG